MRAHDNGCFFSYPDELSGDACHIAAADALVAKFVHTVRGRYPGGQWFDIACFPTRARASQALKAYAGSPYSTRIGKRRTVPSDYEFDL